MFRKPQMWFQTPFAMPTGDQQSVRQVRCSLATVCLLRLLRTPFSAQVLLVWCSIFQVNSIEVPRRELTESIRQALRQNPVTALIRPRQCGKTTLARQLAAQEPHEYFDLETPSDLERLADPMTALQPLKGLEEQQKPELLSVLRVVSDRRPSPARFLLLRSASPDLIRL